MPHSDFSLFCLVLYKIHLTLRLFFNNHFKIYNND